MNKMKKQTISFRRKDLDWIDANRKHVSRGKWITLVIHYMKGMSYTDNKEWNKIIKESTPYNSHKEK